MAHCNSRNQSIRRQWLIVDTRFLTASHHRFRRSQACHRRQLPTRRTIRSVSRNLLQSARPHHRQANLHRRHLFPSRQLLRFVPIHADRALGLNIGISYANASTERRSGSESDYYSIKQKTHYVGIPISVSYTFLDTRYLTLRLRPCRGSIEKCVAATQENAIVAAGNESDKNTFKNEKKSTPSHGKAL